MNIYGVAFKRRHSGRLRWFRVAADGPAGASRIVKTHPEVLHLARQGFREYGISRCS